MLLEMEMEIKQGSKTYRNHPKNPSNHRIVILRQLVGLGVEMWIWRVNEDRRWRELIEREKDREGL